MLGNHNDDNKQQKKESTMPEESYITPFSLPLAFSLIFTLAWGIL
jgi:hypothetical protein